MELLIAEERKIWRKSYGFWILLAVVILKLVSLEIEDRNGNRFISENRDEYLPIVSRYEGKITDSTAALIEAENSEVNLAAANLKALRSEFAAEKITSSEFRTEAARLEEYVYKKELYLYFFSQYLTAREDPERRYILFKEGWDRFFSADRFDWFTSIAAIVFAAFVFGKEYEVDMRRIQITTVNGNRALTYAKFLTLFTSIAALWAVSFLAEWAFFQVRYGLPDGSFPFQSLSIFQSSALNLSLNQAVWALFLIRLAGSCVLGVLVMTVTVAAESVVPALIAGLGLVTLPYALPLDASLKAVLPTPFSLILGMPFLAPTGVQGTGAEALSGDVILTNGIVIGIAVFWTAISAGALTLIRRQFCHVEARSGKRARSIPASILILALTFVMLAMAGCSAAGTTDEAETPLTFNFGNDSYYSYADPYIVSLFPDFMIEDLNSGALDRVVRDPFLDDEYIYKYVAGIFLHEGQLYYSVTTDDHDEIIGVDLKGWDQRRIYYHSQPGEVKLLNDDLEEHQWSLGKRDLPFMIYGDSLFLYSDHGVKMVSLTTGKETLLIRHVLYPSALTFRDGKFYYTNAVNEVRVFSLDDRSDLPLSGVRAEFTLFIRGDLLYFFDIDREDALYSVDLTTKALKKVAAGGIGMYTVDDDFLYYADDSSDGFVYRIDLATGEKSLLLDEPHASNLQVIDGTPYLYVRIASWTPENVTIDTYRIDRTDWRVERLDAYDEFNPDA